jgi:3-hydroxybutyryl-CoA dehydrogenase
MTIQKIAVIGAGVAGRAFALRCAQTGYAVALEDVMPEKLRRAQDEYAGFGELAVRFATTVEDAVSDADLAIDFVPDELESKLEIFSLLDRMAPPRTVLLTPTNALSITDLASCTYRAERCVGLQGDLLTLDIRVMRSRFISAEVLGEVVQFLEKVGVAVQVVEDLEPQLVKNS